jgi:hypothetical protein
MPTERTAIPSTLCPTTVSEGLLIALKNQITPSFLRIVDAHWNATCLLSW